MSDLSGHAAKSDRAAGRAPTTHLCVLSSAHLFEGLQSGFLELSGLLAAALSIILGREGNSVTLVEQRQYRLFDGGRVHNTSLEPSSGVMEPKPLALLKKLNCSGESHDKPFDVAWQELMNGPTHSPDDSGSGKGSAGDGIHLTKK